MRGATPPQGTNHRPSQHASDSLICGKRPAASHHAPSISARSLRRSRPPTGTPRSTPQPNSCPQACRWRDALLAVADERYADAATLYEEIGSQPLAADAHLLAARQAADEGRTADAHQHAEAVLALRRADGRFALRARAEAFVKASA